MSDWEEKMIAEYERRYIRATYLYYHGPSDVESPISDEEYDRVQTVLQGWRHRTSKAFQSRTEIPLKASAHAMAFTEDEKRDAIEWARRGGTSVRDLRKELGLE